MNDKDLESVHGINFAAISKDARLPGVVRVAADFIMSRDYTTVGDWLQQLPLEDLALLNLLFEAAARTGTMSDCLAVICMMFGFSEGIEPFTDGEKAVAAVDSLMELVEAESLHRAGVIEFNHKYGTLTKLTDEQREKAFVLKDLSVIGMLKK